MNWNRHSELEGKHAIFSPSQSAWLRYGEGKIYESLVSAYAPTVGTLLHEFAAEHIRFNIKLTKASRSEALLYLLKNNIPYMAIDMEYLFPNLVNYVNDAIGFKMSPEVMLWYSDNCFGTTDAITFRNNFLRIHDLKTGKTGKMEQLMVYAALFCLEYKVDPRKIETELRIYQNGEILYHKPQPEEILEIMETIKACDKTIFRIMEREG